MPGSETFVKAETHRPFPSSSLNLPHGSFCISWWLMSTLGFPGGASGKEPTCQCRRHGSPSFDPWIRKIPWTRAWQPTPVVFPGECHEQKSLAGYSPRRAGHDWGHWVHARTRCPSFWQDCEQDGDPGFGSPVLLQHWESDGHIASARCVCFEGMNILLLSTVAAEEECLMIWDPGAQLPFHLVSADRK